MIDEKGVGLRRIERVDGVKVDDDDLLSGRICFFSLFLRRGYCQHAVVRLSGYSRNVHRNGKSVPVLEFTEVPFAAVIVCFCLTIRCVFLGDDLALTFDNQNRRP